MCIITCDGFVFSFFASVQTDNFISVFNVDNFSPVENCSVFFSNKAEN